MLRKLRSVRSSLKSTASTKSQTYHTLVRPVHFVSLLEMFVVPEDDFSLWLQINQNCNIIANKQPIVSYVELNSLYLVNYKDKWYRGRIVSMERQESFYLCQLIDLGPTVNVNKGEIRKITEELEKYKEFVEKCALFNIIEVDNIHDAIFALEYLLLQ